MCDCIQTFFLRMTAQCLSDLAVSPLNSLVLETSALLIVGEVMRLTVHELAIVVANALAQIEVALLAVALCIKQRSTEDWHLSVALDGELDVLGGVSKALTVPEKVACYT